VFTWLVIISISPLVIYLLVAFLYHQDSTKSMPTKAKVETCIFDYLIALSFGTTAKDIILTTNRDLAAAVRQLLISALIKHKNSSDQIPMPSVVAQEEVVEALRDQLNESVSHSNVFTINSRSEKGAYMGSLDVLIEALEVIDVSAPHGIIVVHPTMWLRVDMLAYSLRLNHFEVRVTSEGYDHKSDQWWTRKALWMWLSEPIKYAVDYVRVRKRLRLMED